MKSIFSPLYDDKTKDFFKENEKVFEFLKKRLISKIGAREKEIAERGFQISRNIFVESGDIIYRPLSFLKNDLSIDMNHYGIVFGRMENGELLILENSKGTNIGFKTLEAFADTHLLSDIDVEKRPKDVTFDLILERAKEVEHDRYSETYFNCRHFVNYCVYGEKISEQIETIKSIISPLLRIIVEYQKGVSSLYVNEKDKKIVLQIAKKIELVTNEIDKLQ